GGDRDGNPNVTAAVTLQALGVHAEHALAALEAVARRVGRSLTADAATTPASPDLRERLQAARVRDPERLQAIEARAPGEPHRVFLVHVADRIRATVRDEPTLRYSSPDQLLEDVQAAQRSLAAAGAGRLAF